MNTIRICGLSKRLNGNGPAISRGDRFRHHLFAGSDFPLADRRPAFGAEIIEDLSVGQNYHQLLTDAGRGPAFLAIQGPTCEILKFLLTRVLPLFTSLS